MTDEERYHPASYGAALCLVWIADWECVSKGWFDQTAQPAHGDQDVVQAAFPREDLTKMLIWFIRTAKHLAGDVEMALKQASSLPLENFFSQMRSWSGKDQRWAQWIFAILRKIATDGDPRRNRMRDPGSNHRLRHKQARIRVRNRGPVDPSDLPPLRQFAVNIVRLVRATAGVPTFGAALLPDLLRPGVPVASLAAREKTTPPNVPLRGHRLLSTSAVGMTRMPAGNSVVRFARLSAVRRMLRAADAPLPDDADGEPLDVGVD